MRQPCLKLIPLYTISFYLLSNIDINIYVPINHPSNLFLISILIYAIYSDMIRLCRSESVAKSIVSSPLEIRNTSPTLSRLVLLPCCRPPFSLCGIPGSSRELLACYGLSSLHLASLWFAEELLSIVHEIFGRPGFFSEASFGSAWPSWIALIAVYVGFWMFSHVNFSIGTTKWCIDAMLGYSSVFALIQMTTNSPTWKLFTCSSRF